jgi:lysophospholipase L1-like esterase
MNKINQIYVYLLGAALLFSACNTEDELIEERLAQNPLPSETSLSGSPGSVNFSKYVAIGNSITAGLMDAALYSNGQFNAFPNILANHLDAVEGISIGAFNQPDINSANGFNFLANDLNNPEPPFAGRFVLDLSIPGPVPTVGELPTAYAGDRSALNNFGVPGARLLDVLVPGYAQFNPLYGRFASAPDASVLGDATAAQGTFFTLWLGSNDVLGWASAGGDAPDGEEDPAAEQTNPSTLTSIASFQQAYAAALQAMLAASPEAKGVAITIPSVTLSPLFRAVPYNPIPLDEANANALNQGYADYNAGIQAAAQFGAISQEEAALRSISFSAGAANPVVIADEELSDISLPNPEGGDPIVLPKIRQSNPSDLLIFNVAPLLGSNTEGGPYGLQVPVENQFVLTLNEQVTLNTRIATFNFIIAQTVAATQGNVALLDINAIYADVAGLTPEQATLLGLSADAIAAADGAQGIVVNGVNLQPDFSPNGIISTDGVHPNPKGHALVANEIIRVINESFGAEIPPVDITPFRTVVAAGP